MFNIISLDLLKHSSNIGYGLHQSGWHGIINSMFAHLYHLIPAYPQLDKLATYLIYTSELLTPSLRVVRKANELFDIFGWRVPLASLTPLSGL